MSMEFILLIVSACAFVLIIITVGHIVRRKRLRKVGRIKIYRIKDSKP